MRNAGILIKRNILLYIRDRATVFFSLLTMMIVLLLMLVFLGDMNTEEVLWLLKQYGGTRDTLVDKANAEELITKWTLAGILVTNAVTVSLTMIGFLVRDEEEGKSLCFFCAPVKRMEITLGYIGASIVVSCIMCTVTLVLAELYLAAAGKAVFSLAENVALMGVIFLNSLVYGCIMFLLSLMVHSNGAWSGLGTVIGTIVGFLGGIYVPVGALLESVVNVLKFQPVLYSTALARNICTKEVTQRTFKDVPAKVLEEYWYMMGITIKIGEKEIGTGMQVLFLLITAIIAVGISVMILQRRSLRDR